MNQEIQFFSFVQVKQDLESGAVDWQTTPKTSNFTAVGSEGYFINSSSGITMNLPAGSAGAIVAVSDYAEILQHMYSL